MQQDIKKAVERHRNALFITAVAGEPTTLLVCLTKVFLDQGFLLFALLFVNPSRVFLAKETRP